MRVPTISGKQADIGDDQRMLSAFAGSMLLYFVAKRHKVESLLLLGGGYLIYRAVTGQCPVTSALRAAPRQGSNVNIRTSVIVNQPREAVYAYWRRLENWPLFMRHLGSVDEIGNNTSVWRMKAPGMDELRWEAKIVKDEKDTELSWHSAEGSPIEATAKINFSDTPADATRVDVMLSYRAPAGALGEKLSGLLTPAFRCRIQEDVLNFKHYFENLGIPRRDGVGKNSDMVAD
ncbi:MAG TPA: SRPBCC family protein [Puia sp.]|nr:SRPBCC family protein [Puia sp.]